MEGRGTRGNVGILAAMAVMLGVGGSATSDAVQTFKLSKLDAAGGIPTPDVPRVPHRGRGHKHKVPHRGTSRRANRNAKRRRARARAR